MVRFIRIQKVYAEALNDFFLRICKKDNTTYSFNKIFEILYSTSEANFAVLMIPDGFKLPVQLVSEYNAVVDDMVSTMSGVLNNPNRIKTFKDKIALAVTNRLDVVDLIIPYATEVNETFLVNNGYLVATNPRI